MNSPKLKSPKGDFSLGLATPETSSRTIVSARIHFAEAIPTVDIASGRGLERHLRCRTAFGAGDVKHRTIAESASLILKSHFTSDK